jgi:hypothetical protein
MAGREAWFEETTPWRKLHLGTDADTGQIVAAELTSHDIDDGSQVGPLLEQVARPVASFTGDGAYDRDDVYSEVSERHPDAAVIVPPRSAAVPSAAAETTPTRRDRHLQAGSFTNGKVYRQLNRAQIVRLSHESAGDLQ